MNPAKPKGRRRETRGEQGAAEYLLKPNRFTSVADAVGVFHNKPNESDYEPIHRV